MDKGLRGKDITFASVNQIEMDISPDLGEGEALGVSPFLLCKRKAA